MYSFNYCRPQTVEEARSLLQSLESPKLLAGGQTFIPAMKQRLAQPSDLIDLGAIAELRGIRQESDRLIIGAMTPHAEVAASVLVRELIPAVAGLAGNIGDRQVRHRGTIGGSISNNDPAADYPSALLALGAKVGTDRREIGAEEFFVDMFETALEPDEIVIEVRFPRPLRAAYAKFPNPASRYATVGVFVAQFAHGVRVAVTGAASSVFRATDLEAALNADFSPAALEGIEADPGQLNGDMHASAEYRANLINVMARRAVQACA
jgi:carbon-monoxide dehydrogenase medium subunit